jgi:hypothetical protein
MPPNHDEIERLKAALQEAKFRDQIRRLERQGRLATWNDYTSFYVSKAIGAGAMILGGVDSIAPTFLPTHFSKPGIVFGTGVALLTGRNVITLVAKLNKVLGGDS